jgi:hypothetical protein
MKKEKKKPVIILFTIFIVLLFFFTLLQPQTEAGLLKKKDTIKVAFLWQRWDILDIPARLGMAIYKKILRQAEEEYHVNIEVYEFWDWKHGGDVQNGKLMSMDIDVAVGPGGFGGWVSPRAYRTEIREFVRSGGGFYGICGDSTFGSLGVINLPFGYKNPLKKATGSRTLTPMLGLANVYTDASAFDSILSNPFRFKKTDIIKMVGQLPISRAPIKIESTMMVHIQDPYKGERVRVMLGNAPLVDGPRLLRLFMPKVYTLAEFKGTDDPYDKILKGGKAMVATWYGKGRVVLSVAHPELTIANSKAHDLFVRNLLWCAKSLPIKDQLLNSLPLLFSLYHSDDVEHPLFWYLLLTADF